MSQRNRHEDPEVLAELYWEEDLSQREIADRFDVSQGKIWKVMDRHDIPTRKSRNDPTRPPSHAFAKESDVVGTEYEAIHTTIDYQPYTLKVHRLIAVAYEIITPEEFFDTDTIVHHESGHGLDNRPGNLSVMTRADHQSHHMKERYG